MTSDILVVYKKNFEDVHDKSLETVRESLDELVRDRGMRLLSRPARQSAGRTSPVATSWSYSVVTGP